MPKRYLFFYRNNSDIDHLSPVIYGLIKNGVDAPLITYSDLWPHQTLINCKRDPRLKFLKQLGVKVEQSKINILYLHFHNFFLNLKNDNKFNWIINRFFWSNEYAESFYNYFLKIFFRFRILKSTNELHEGDRVVFDHDFSFATKKILQIINGKGLRTYSLPHGLVFVENKNPPPIETYRNDEFLKAFDHIAYTTSLAARMDGFQEDEVDILGSVRFCKEWVKELEKVYEPIRKPKDKTISVLLLAHKKEGNINGVWQEFVYEDQIKKVIEFLTGLKELQLFIKHHPNKAEYKSERNKDFDCYKSEKAFHINSSEPSTFQLIKSSDLVISLTSSAIVDASVLSKEIGILKFATPLNLIFHEYFPRNVFSEFNEFKNYIYDLISSKKEIDVSGYQKFYKDNVEPTDSSLNVYANYLMKD